MKRILYSCFLFVSILVSGTLNAQVTNFTFTPGQTNNPINTICYNNSGVYVVDAAYLPNNPAATTYTWVFQTPTPTCIPTFTALPGGAPTNSYITITFPCCGIYTVNSFALQNNTPVGTVIQTFEIICPSASSATITTPSQTTTGNAAVCIGATTTITASGAATYTWSNGFVGNPLLVSPTVNTCYTYTGTTAQGCTITPLAGNCLSVQAINATLTPASQTMCLGSPVTFTAQAGIVTGSSVTAGTSVTGYHWEQPPSQLPPVYFSSTTTNALLNTTSTLAIGGNYSVNITHTGAAGTCTLTKTAAVVISTSIPVTITPSSASVCPGANFTLTGVSVQTAAAQYTWYRDNNASGSPSIALTSGNPLVQNIPAGQFPRTFSVNVNFGGCPGFTTITIQQLTLTPVLTSSSPSTCPGRSLTLTSPSTAATTYTFYNIPSTGGTFIIPKALPTTFTVAHTPSGANLPIQYCVATASTGCTGTTCIVVDLKTLTPSLTASSASVCPGTEFTLRTQGSGVGAGTNYTFSSTYSTSLYAGTSFSLQHTPTGTNITLPQCYTVTIDSAGCTGTAFTCIDLLSLTPTLSSSSPSICTGQQFTLTTKGGVGPVSSYTFTSASPAFSNSPTSTLVVTNSNTLTHTPTNTLMTYTVSVDSAGCVGTASHTVGILGLGQLIHLSTTPLSGSVCPGTQVTINALGAINYTFIAPPPLNSFTTGISASSKDTVKASPFTPTIIGAGVVYTVQADSSTCVGTQTIIVHEFKLHPTIIISPTLVCSGMPIVITASNVVSNPISQDPSTKYTFLSSAAPGGTLQPSSFSYSATDQPSTQVIYTVLVDSAGCTGPLIPPTATINIKPDLILIPATTAASVCPGLSATLSVLAPTTALSYTYTWSQISGTSQINPPTNTSSLVTYPFTNSTYSVHVLDSLGCVGNTVIPVGIDPLLSFSITLQPTGSTICVSQAPNPPQTVSLSASSTVTPFSFGAINYTWSPANSLSSNTGTSVIGSPSATTIYTVTADNGYGCVSQNTVDITVGQFPILTTPPTTSFVCAGFTSTITAFGANSYTWTGSTFTGSIPQQSIAVTSGTYMVLGSNGGGCTATAVQTISPAFDLTITIAANPSTQTTCITSNSPKFSKPVHLTASGAGTYVWFPYNPLHMTYSLGAQTDVRPPTTTQYTVVGSTANCSGRGIITITVIPQFTMNVVPPLPAMCLGDSLQLSIVNITPLGPLVAGPVSAFTYSWTEALNAPPISMSAYFQPTVMVFPQNTTTYTTEVRDSRACISMPRLVTVTVLPKPVTAIAIPTINSVPTNTVCYVGLNPGDPDVTINLTGNNLNSGLQFGVVPTYTWVSPYAPAYNSILTPPNNNAVVVSAPIRVLNNSAVAVYTLISGYNGVQGCRRQDTVSIRAIDCRPVRNFTFTTAEAADTICSRTCITYINQADTMAGGPQTYTWTFKGGNPSVSHEQNPTICYNFPGKYDVLLQVSNPYPRTVTSGVPGSTNVKAEPSLIKVVDVPNVTIVAPGQVRSDTIVRFGQSVALNGSGALVYEWSPAYNISSLTKPKVTVNPFKTTQYILTGYNSKRCSSSDTINVIIVEDCGEMYVPNAFTPNNDGVNDVLYVRGICLQSLTFMIFNRWGEKVFETAEQSTGWDGNYKGEEMNTGVFVYRLEGKTYEGKGFSSKGNITLIR